MLRDDDALARPARRRARDGAGPPAPAAGRALRPPLPQPRRAVRGPRPGRHDRPDQVDRPVRHRPRRGVLDLRDPDDHRRDQALLPRQGLGDPGAAPAPGAADADRRRRPPSSPRSWAAPPRRASSPRRSAARSRRSSRASSRATPTPRCPWTPPTTPTTAPPSMLDALGVDDEASSTSRSASRSSRCSSGWTRERSRSCCCGSSRT